MATTKISSGVVGDSAVTYNKLNANTAHIDRVQSFTVAQRGAVSALGVQTSTVNISLTDANHYSITTNGNITIANPTNVNAGQGGSIVLTSNGNYTV